jgi:hypothetical protein
MPKTVFKPAGLQEIRERLSRLRPDSARQFGKMNAHQMMCHMEDALRVSTGERPARSKNSFMAKPIVRWLVIYLVPWPKGKAETVPEMLLTKPGNFEDDRSRLVTLLRQTAERGPSAEWAVHPAFGNITGKDYGVLIYRHFDHHLRQFGV